MTLCNDMSSEPKPNPAAVSLRCGPPKHDHPLPSSVAERIAAFLDGRTQGEELLHELYDYILEEPIPQRLRAVLTG
jgi:hypothetical protein